MDNGAAALVACDRPNRGFCNGVDDGHAVELGRSARPVLRPDLDVWCFRAVAATLPPSAANARPSRKAGVNPRFTSVALLAKSAITGRGGDPGAPSTGLGTRHVAFAGGGIDDVLDRLRARGAELVGELEQYETATGSPLRPRPRGIIIELAERIG